MAQQCRLFEFTDKETARVFELQKRLEDELDEEDEAGQVVLATLGEFVNKLKEAKASVILISCDVSH